METGYTIRSTGSRERGSTMRAVIYRVSIFTILPAAFIGQPLFFTPFYSNKSHDVTHRKHRWSDIFPSRPAQRVIRRSLLNAATGLFRPNLRGKEAPRHINCSRF